MNQIKKLRSLFKFYKIDGYIIPKNDEFFGEYISENKDNLKFSYMDQPYNFTIKTVDRSFGKIVTKIDDKSLSSQLIYDGSYNKLSLYTVLSIDSIATDTITLDEFGPSGIYFFNSTTIKYDKNQVTFHYTGSFSIIKSGKASL